MAIGLTLKDVGNVGNGVSIQIGIFRISGLRISGGHLDNFISWNLLLPIFTLEKPSKTN